MQASFTSFNQGFFIALTLKMECNHSGHLGIHDLDLVLRVELYANELFWKDEK